MKYEYKKITGYEQKKFIKNGHTMFEQDVLQRLKRLAYLEDQLKQWQLLHVAMPRVLHFVDENGNNVDLNAAGVNAKLLRDGTFEYFISYGFAGRKELTPVYGA